MKLLIDADACPVVDICLSLAGKCEVPVLLFCDTAHFMQREGARTIMVGQGADSADFALVNAAQKGDIVVTQDYGLAAMALSRGAEVLRQDGLRYTAENIDALLLQRHTSAKLRRGGTHLKGPKKRTREDDARFAEALRQLLAPHQAL